MPNATSAFDTLEGAIADALSLLPSAKRPDVSRSLGHPPPKAQLQSLSEANEGRYHLPRSAYLAQAQCLPVVSPDAPARSQRLEAALDSLHHRAAQLHVHSPLPAAQPRTDWNQPYSHSRAQQFASTTNNGPPPQLQSQPSQQAPLQPPSEPQPSPLIAPDPNPAEPEPADFVNAEVQARGVVLARLEVCLTFTML